MYFTHRLNDLPVTKFDFDYISESLPYRQSCSLRLRLWLTIFNSQKQKHCSDCSYVWHPLIWWSENISNFFLRFVFQPKMESVVNNGITRAMSHIKKWPKRYWQQNNYILYKRITRDVLELSNVSFAGVLNLISADENYWWFCQPLHKIPVGSTIIVSSRLRALD